MLRLPGVNYYSSVKSYRNPINTHRDSSRIPHVYTVTNGILVKYHTHKTHQTPQESRTSTLKFLLDPIVTHWDSSSALLSICPKCPQHSEVLRGFASSGIDKVFFHEVLTNLTHHHLDSSWVLTLRDGSQLLSICLPQSFCSARPHFATVPNPFDLYSTAILFGKPTLHQYFEHISICLSPVLLFGKTTFRPQSPSRTYRVAEHHPSPLPNNENPESFPTDLW